MSAHQAVSFIPLPLASRESSIPYMDRSVEAYPSKEHEILSSEFWAAVSRYRGIRIKRKWSLRRFEAASLTGHGLAKGDP